MKKQIRKLKLNLLKKLKKIAVQCFRVLYRVFHRFIKTDEKCVLFLAYHGRGYTCNPRAVFEYMQAQEEFKEYTFVWAIKKKQHIENAKVVRYNLFTYYYYLAKSKYWVFNCKMPKYIIKKDTQVYLQTWHGTPLKRLAHDILAKDGLKFYRSEMSFQQMTQTYDEDVKKYDYMISPNAYSTSIFQSAFRVNHDVLIETGYPRNDFLTNITKNQIHMLKKKYNISENKKVILYAPTWRDTSFDLKGYIFELEADFHKWKQSLGEEYVVIFKPHYLIVNRFDLSDLDDFIIQVDPNMDINELYVVSDVLVTDYSSVFFDFANLGRPIYFYMFDLAQYANELRGFYISLEDLPGEIYEQEQSLLDAIASQNYDVQKLQQFNTIYNALQDGKASERVIHWMMKGSVKHED